jgi:hypothetical protein
MAEPNYIIEVVLRTVGGEPETREILRASAPLHAADHVEAMLTASLYVRRLLMGAAKLQDDQAVDWENRL